MIIVCLDSQWLNTEKEEFPGECLHIINYDFVCLLMVREIVSHTNSCLSLTLTGSI